MTAAGLSTRNRDIRHLAQFKPAQPEHIKAAHTIESILGKAGDRGHIWQPFFSYVIVKVVQIEMQDWQISKRGSCKCCSLNFDKALFRKGVCWERNSTCLWIHWQTLHVNKSITTPALEKKQHSWSYILSDVFFSFLWQHLRLCFLPPAVPTIYA